MLRLFNNTRISTPFKFHKQEQGGQEKSRESLQESCREQIFPKLECLEKSPFQNEKSLISLGPDDAAQLPHFKPSVERSC